MDGQGSARLWRMQEEDEMKRSNIDNYYINGVGWLWPSVIAVDALIMANNKLQGVVAVIEWFTFFLFLFPFFFSTVSSFVVLYAVEKPRSPGITDFRKCPGPITILGRVKCGAMITADLVFGPSESSVASKVVVNKIVSNGHSLSINKFCGILS